MNKIELKMNLIKCLITWKIFKKSSKKIKSKQINNKKIKLKKRFLQSKIIKLCKPKRDRSAKE